MSKGNNLDLRYSALALAVITHLIIASSAVAQPSYTFDAAKKGSLANLTPVIAPSARAAALHDALGILAFIHERNYDTHVSLFRLDAKGTPSIDASQWKLPCPPGLMKAGNYPLALAFHPKLPLLYVWQDVGIQFGNPPAAPSAELDPFDHLLVYDVAKDPPTLVTSLVRGKTGGILHGQQAGGLTVDRDGTFLYVPNFHDPKNYSYFQFGRFPLDAEGLPDILGEKDGKLPRDQRLKKLAERNVAGPLLPPQVTPFNYGYIVCYNQHGAGACFYPLSADAILSSAARGLVLWRPNDKDSGLNAIPLKNVNYVLFAVHPTLPFVYATVPDATFLYFVRHADGYPTLLPELWTAPMKLTSKPVVLGKSGKVAVGTIYHLYLFTPDAQGRPGRDLTQVPVFNPAVRAMIYSERFDRLYVSTELSK
jgi:hypothetical protein